MRYAAIVDLAADGILTIDESGAIMSFNRAAERILGCPAAEVVERNVRILTPLPYRDEDDRYLRRYLVVGEANILGRGHEVSGWRADCEIFPFYLAVSEVTANRPRIFTGIVHDLTAQKEAERQLLELKEVADGGSRPVKTGGPRGQHLLYSRAWQGYDRPQAT